jgi:hypothetical protein
MKKVICGDVELAKFRSELKGERLVKMVTGCDGPMLVNLAIGVGKSTCMDESTEAAIRSGVYDLVVVLVPLRQMIDERAAIKFPPVDLKVVNLRPRPRDLCGTVNDQRWQPLAKNGLGTLGRSRICGPCPNRSDCYWPDQLGKGLKDCQVVFGTQARLKRSPDLLSRITSRAGAKRVLLILDEVNFSLTTYRKSFSYRQLHNYLSALKVAGKSGKHTQNKEWVYLCEQLQRAPSRDLHSFEWQTPWPSADWLLDVQSEGFDQHGEYFRCLAHDIQQFCKSPIESREKGPDGAISYAMTPGVPENCIVFSGSASVELTSFRLGKQVHSPFIDYSFEHPETVWHNIASRLGMRSYFKNNSPQILDFFTMLISRRIQDGRRCLLITKKCFLDFCQSKLQASLRQAGHHSVVICSGEFTPEILADPNVIPIINYGMIGTNLFQEFECAYCLNGYYTRIEAVNSVLQDLLPSDIEIPLQIKTAGYPLRRTISVVHAEHEHYDVSKLASPTLDQLEMEVVTQAVGRVRPYTKPREVITFQCNAPTTNRYNHEHDSLTAARKHFSLLSKRQRDKAKVTSDVAQAKARGLSQTEAATLLGVSLRTIKRRWNP